MGITFQPFNQTLSGSTVYNYFVNKGYSPYGAAALAGRAQNESAFNTGATSPSGTYIGLFQWSPQRRQIAANAGFDLSTAQGQLDFAHYELTTVPAYGGNSIMNATNLADAQTTVTNRFEGAPGQGYTQALGYSQNILNANSNNDGSTVDPSMIQQTGISNIPTPNPNNPGYNMDGTKIGQEKGPQNLIPKLNIFGSFSDYFVRATFIVLGMIIIAGSLYLIGREKGSV